MRIVSPGGRHTMLMHWTCSFTTLLQCLMTMITTTTTTMMMMMIVGTATAVSTSAASSNTHTMTMLMMLPPSRSHINPAARALQEQQQHQGPLDDDYVPIQLSLWFQDPLVQEEVLLGLGNTRQIVTKAVIQTLQPLLCFETSDLILQQQQQQDVVQLQQGDNITSTNSTNTTTTTWINVCTNSTFFDTSNSNVSVSTDTHMDATPDVSMRSQSYQTRTWTTWTLQYLVYAMGDFYRQEAALNNPLLVQLDPDLPLTQTAWRSATLSAMQHSMQLVVDVNLMTQADDFQHQLQQQIIMASGGTFNTTVLVSPIRREVQTFFNGDGGGGAGSPAVPISGSLSDPFVPRTWYPLRITGLVMLALSLLIFCTLPWCASASRRRRGKQGHQQPESTLTMATMGPSQFMSSRNMPASGTRIPSNRISTSHRAIMMAQHRGVVYTETKPPTAAAAAFVPSLTATTTTTTADLPQLQSPEGVDEMLHQSTLVAVQATAAATAADTAVAIRPVEDGNRNEDDEDDDGVDPAARVNGTSISTGTMRHPNNNDDNVMPVLVPASSSSSSSSNHSSGTSNHNHTTTVTSNCVRSDNISCSRSKSSDRSSSGDQLDQEQKTSNSSTPDTTLDRTSVPGQQRSPSRASSHRSSTSGLSGEANASTASVSSTTHLVELVSTSGSSSRSSKERHAPVQSAPSSSSSSKSPSATTPLIELVTASSTSGSSGRSHDLAMATMTAESTLQTPTQAHWQQHGLAITKSTNAPNKSGSMHSSKDDSIGSTKMTKSSQPGDTNSQSRSSNSQSHRSSRRHDKHPPGTSEASGGSRKESKESPSSSLDVEQQGSSTVFSSLSTSSSENNNSNKPPPLALSLSPSPTVASTMTDDALPSDSPRHGCSGAGVAKDCSHNDERATAPMKGDDQPQSDSVDHHQGRDSVIVDQYPAVNESIRPAISMALDTAYVGTAAAYAALHRSRSAPMRPEDVASSPSSAPLAVPTVPSVVSDITMLVSDLSAQSILSDEYDVDSNGKGNGQRKNNILERYGINEWFDLDPSQRSAVTDSVDSTDKHNEDDDDDKAKIRRDETVLQVTSFDTVRDVDVFSMANRLCSDSLSSSASPSTASTDPKCTRPSLSKALSSSGSAPDSSTGQLLDSKPKHHHHPNSSSMSHHSSPKNRPGVRPLRPFASTTEGPINTESGKGPQGTTTKVVQAATTKKTSAFNNSSSSSSSPRRNAGANPSAARPNSNKPNQPAQNDDHHFDDSNNDDHEHDASISLFSLPQSLMKQFMPS